MISDTIGKPLTSQRWARQVSSVRSHSPWITSRWAWRVAHRPGGGHPLTPQGRTPDLPVIVAQRFRHVLEALGHFVAHQPVSEMRQQLRICHPVGSVDESVNPLAKVLIGQANNGTRTHLWVR